MSGAHERVSKQLSDYEENRIASKCKEDAGAGAEVSELVSKAAKHQCPAKSVKYASYKNEKLIENYVFNICHSTMAG